MNQNDVTPAGLEVDEDNRMSLYEVRQLVLGDLIDDLDKHGDPAMFLEMSDAKSSDEYVAIVLLRGHDGAQLGVKFQDAMRGLAERRTHEAKRTAELLARTGNRQEATESIERLRESIASLDETVREVWANDVPGHNEFCDVNDRNAEGIVKPCNCGAARTEH